MIKLIIIIVLFNTLYAASLSVNTYDIKRFAKYISVTKNVKISKCYIPEM